ncbi:MAG: hypothetical protein J0L81_13120 [Caulobacterales bacterium]|nr:hypothetical protein [Caulobacterales bacterium]
MAGLNGLRTVLLAGSALVATALGASFAGAQEALEPGQVDFADPAVALTNPEAPSLQLDVDENATRRFESASLNTSRDDEGPRRVEVELAAGGRNSPIDISIAQRASLGANAEGEVDRTGRGSEVRVGRGLVDRRESDGNERSVYMFVASEDEALTWQPGARSDFGGQGSSVSLQDRVEVGDLAAGVTYERNGVQASLAYVEREESTRIGRQNYSQDQSFTGVTVTMRR